jgi:hypothetical protein
MDEATTKQKNISSYFSNLKRNSSDFTAENKLETFTSLNNKREKKEIVRLGDSSNYTINKYFQFSKEESCLNEIKSNLKNLQIHSKKLFSENLNLNLNPDKDNFQENFKKIDRYFKTDRLSLRTDHNTNSNLERNSEENIFIPNQIGITNVIQITQNEEHKVFSLDHFEVSGDNNNRLKIKSKYDSSENNFNLNSNSHLNSLSIQNHIQQNNFNFPQKKLFSYEDTKITNWIKHTTYNNLNGLNENICQNILKYLTFKELTQSSVTNKTFYNFYKTTINSYFYFNSLDTNKILTKKEFQEILKKGKNLKHIQKLIEIVKSDFGGEKFGAENFYNKMIVMMVVSPVDDLKYKGALLESFKIKPKKDFHINNFISNESLLSICQSSKYTLKDLSLRGCYKLTNRVGLGISMCQFLERLELSFNNNIDDETIVKIAENCRNLKVLNLANMKTITGKSVISICNNLKQLEGLDLSEAVNVNGDSLYLLKNCERLNRLLLNSIQMRDSDLNFTGNLKELKTLSISSKINYINFQ